MLQSYYFDRDDVCLPGMRKFFKESSDEEREHAEKLMKVRRCWERDELAKYFHKNRNAYLKIAQNRHK